MPATRRLLVIEDQAAQAAVIREVAEAMGHSVTAVTDPRQAIATFEAVRPDLIILDVVMPDMDGHDVLRALGAVGCAVPILLVSGYDPKYMQDANKLAGHFGIRKLSTMQKPLRIDALRQFIRDSLSAP